MRRQPVDSARVERTFRCNGHRCTMTVTLEAGAIAIAATWEPGPPAPGELVGQDLEKYKTEKARTLAEFKRQTGILLAPPSPVLPLPAKGRHR